jgi:hypothetical protein
VAEIYREGATPQRRGFNEIPADVLGEVDKYFG